jgi:hypothetical protein
VHTCEEDGGAFEVVDGVDDRAVDEVVLDELLDDGIVVDEDEDDVVIDFFPVVDVDEDDVVMALFAVVEEDDEDEEEDEDVAVSDGGEGNGVESVAKTGEMATSPTNPTARATSERRCMNTPISRLPDRSSPRDHRSATGTRGEPQI